MAVSISSGHERGPEVFERKANGTFQRITSLWAYGADYGDTALKCNPATGALYVEGGAAGLVDDAAFTPGTSTVSPFGAFFDDVTPDSVNEGDIGAVRMSGNRNLYVQVRDAAGNERGLNIDANGRLGGVPDGNVAHDAADSGNPLKIGGKAETTVRAAVADGDRVDAWFDEYGAQAALDAGSAYDEARANVSSADLTTAADLTAAPTSGQKIVVSDLFVSADTAMRLDFLEETSGTVILSLYLTASGWGQATPRGKLKLPTADKKLRVQASAAGNVRIMCLYRSEA